MSERTVALTAVSVSPAVSVSYRNVRPDESFVVEMARHASTIEDRPLLSVDDPAVQAMLPLSPDCAVIAVDVSGRRLGAAWWLERDRAASRDPVDTRAERPPGTS
jgi:hypothetical protein